MLYEFPAVNDLPSKIAALMIIFALIFMLVIDCFMKESLAKITIMMTLGILAVTSFLYLLFHSSSSKRISYEEKFVEYFHETPEAINLERGGDFTVETKNKIYCFERIKDDYYSVEIFENTDSEQR